MNRAVVSIGTNTVRVLVVRDETGHPLRQLEHRQTGTRLGEGLADDGMLEVAAVERTLAAVEAFVTVARAYGARPTCVATSAVRRARDAEAFGERIRAIAGVPLRVLDGRSEAVASFRGATEGLPHDGVRVAVVDVGGGSTECAVGADGRLSDARSIEIGSVRVAERFAALAGGQPGAAARDAACAARAFAAAALAPLRDLRPAPRIRCVAGTPLTVAAVLHGSHVEAVSGTELSVADLDATIDRLLDLTLAERRALPGMLPQRADILPAGAIVVSEALRALDATAARLESNDLLLGFLLLEREAAKAE